MVNENFNLVDDKWIPVIFVDGKEGMASLKDVFSMENILDVDTKPIEYVSIYNLLIGITTNAIGPTNLADEDCWLESKSNVAPVSLDYILRNRDLFNLYGDNAFMQLDIIKPTKKNNLDEIEKMFLDRASGENGHTLFDKSRVISGNKIPDDAIARGLLTFLQYDVGCCGKSASCLINGTKTNQYAGSAPKRYGGKCDGLAGSHLTTLLKGGTLIDSIWYNLPTIEMLKSMKFTDISNGFGKPFWEYDLNTISVGHCTRLKTAGKNKKSKKSEEIVNVGFNDNNEETFLGRIVPLSRLIKINDDTVIIGDGIRYRTFTDKNGFEAKDFKDIYTPSVVKKNNKEQYNSLIVASTSKHPWRDLESVVSIKSADKPMILDHIATLHDEGVNKRISIGCYGLQCGVKENVCVSQVSWEFITTISGTMNDSTTHEYGDCVRTAESAIGGLSKSLTINYKCIYGKRRDSDTDGLYKSIRASVKTDFWNELNNHSYELAVRTQKDPNDAKSWWYGLVNATLTKVVEDHVRSFDSHSREMYNRVKHDIRKYMKNPLAISVAV